MLDDSQPGTPRVAVDFRCPVCRASLNNLGAMGGVIKCANCKLELPVIQNVPLLTADRRQIDSLIREARESGREAWYVEPQTTQWVGPYRHHLLKRRQYADQVITRYKQERPRPLVALDLGCGDGANIAWLATHFDDLYASDYNLLRLLRASQIEGTRLVFMADVTDYPVADDSFDVIFFNHVLEHIADDKRALAEVRRILRPGGLLILGVPNEGACFWRLAYRLQPSSRASSDHLHFYTAASLAEKCRAAGLVIREIHPIGWGLPHWTLDAKLRSRKWVDDFFEVVGRRIFPSQASSLYLILTK